MKILIIGLPSFAKKAANSLQKFDPENKYIHLDTYYNKKDKIKYLFNLLNADIVYSINGTIYKSAALELALKLGKKIVMHWVGTDVLTATSDFKNSRISKKLVDNSTHFCEVSWIKEELQAININPEIVNFISFDEKNLVSNKWPEKFKVLTYITEHRAEFYGIKEIIELAENLPSIEFHIAGASKLNYSLPANIKLLGWVNSMPELIDEFPVTVRYMKHDGLSSFVLESLSKGKYVVYNNPFQNCNYVRNKQELKREIQFLQEKFESGMLAPNYEGINFIKEKFNSQFILSSLISQFKKLKK